MEASVARYLIVAVGIRVPGVLPKMGSRISRTFVNAHNPRTGRSSFIKHCVRPRSANHLPEFLNLRSVSAEFSIVGPQDCDLFRQLVWDYGIIVYHWASVVEQFFGETNAVMFSCTLATYNFRGRENYRVLLVVVTERMLVDGKGATILRLVGSR